MATATLYVTRTEYTADRRKQNERFDNIDTAIAELKTDVAELKRDMVQVKDNISLLQFEQQRMGAFFRNQLKKIPTLRFEPIPIWDPERGAVLPSDEYFPRNAKEFFDLVRPTTSRALEILRYLITFYNVEWAGMNNNPSEDQVRQAMADENTALSIMDALETRLGLVEENFVAFQNRARAWGVARESNPAPAPRRLLPSDAEEQPLAIRQRTMPAQLSQSPGSSVASDPLAGTTQVDSNSVLSSARERARRSGAPSMSSGAAGGGSS